MSDPASSTITEWGLGLFLAVLLYRTAVAALLEALRALPSIQRRRLLEEEAIGDPMLARLLERPRTLEQALHLWTQGLLIALVVLAWPIRPQVPLGGLALVLATLATVWVLDLALPTLLTARDPGRWLCRLFPLYRPVHPLLAPIVAPMALVTERARAALELEREEEDEEPNEEAVTALLEEGEAEGILEEADRELIRNVVEFGDTVVREVMTPRNRITALPVTATPAEAWNAFKACRHSRLPVYDGSVDHILGFLLLKDLMQEPEGSPRSLRDLLKPAEFVPESKNTLDLLRDLQRRRAHVAVVVDEFGSVSGIVTLEDLLEEVFGEIHDEHEAAADVEPLEPGEFLLSGGLHVEDLEALTGITCPRDGFDTVGGLVMALLGRIPTLGEQVVVDGATLTVQRMDGRRILQVHLKVPAPL